MLIQGGNKMGTALPTIATVGSILGSGAQVYSAVKGAGQPYPQTMPEQDERRKPISISNPYVKSAYTRGK